MRCRTLLLPSTVPWGDALLDAVKQARDVVHRRSTFLVQRRDAGSPGALSKRLVFTALVNEVVASGVLVYLACYLIGDLVAYNARV